MPSREELPDRAAYELVRALYGRAVPVVGAGVAGHGGAPTTAKLVEVLAAEAGVPMDGADLFELTDRFEHRDGREVVNQLVTEQFPSRLHATPALLALARTPSGLVVTPPTTTVSSGPVPELVRARPSPRR